MLQNAYLLAKIGGDTAENEQHFAETLLTNPSVLRERPLRARAGGVPAPDPGLRAPRGHSYGRAQRGPGGRPRPLSAAAAPAGSSGGLSKIGKFCKFLPAGKAFRTGAQTWRSARRPGRIKRSAPATGERRYAGLAFQSLEVWNLR